MQEPIYQDANRPIAKRVDEICVQREASILQLVDVIQSAWSKNDA